MFSVANVLRNSEISQIKSLKNLDIQIARKHYSCAKIHTYTSKRDRVGGYNLIWLSRSKNLE